MDHASELILQTVVGAIFLGILAQVVAGRYKLPAILPLLLLGMATGPFGLEPAFRAIPVFLHDPRSPASGFACSWRKT